MFAGLQMLDWYSELGVCERDCRTARIGVLVQLLEVEVERGHKRPVVGLYREDWIELGAVWRGECRRAGAPRRCLRICSFGLRGAGFWMRVQEIKSSARL